jgi:hypothetical protein
MRLKYTEGSVSDKVVKQIQNHSNEINNKSDAED